MKKLILILTAILLSVFALLTSLSLNDGYTAQRELWRINQKLYYIASYNESTPDNAINQLTDRYHDFINKHSKTLYANQAQLMLGDLYSLRKNYSQARSEFQKAICENKELSAQGEFAIAKTYELEGNQEKALSIYKSIIQYYPLTKTGFFVHIYLARHNATGISQK